MSKTKSVHFIKEVVEMDEVEMMRPKWPEGAVFVLVVDIANRG